MADAAKANCQLSPVESLRACVLLQEALKQLAFIGRLARSQKAAQPAGLAAARGDEIVRLIAEQQQQQDRLQELAGERESLEFGENKINLKAAEAKEKEANYLKLQRERQRIEELLQQTISELKEGNTFKGLLEAVAQEKHAQERLNEVPKP
ncbi:hypothetical protein, conserved [Eimeria necatrix]|uniref:Uncharacterized protein n=1 Tax=Eimeria necatrix TaxID=51315 RepID=U6MW01_9EIME|nr:hypothetical protein, conserved [Eimeria necatrix]CDJ68442.1 hypothetical protein, conserved [Eimeria necatrix]